MINIMNFNNSDDAFNLIDMEKDIADRAKNTTSKFYGPAVPDSHSFKVKYNSFYKFYYVEHKIEEENKNRTDPKKKKVKKKKKNKKKQGDPIVKIQKVEDEVHKNNRQNIADTRHTKATEEQKKRHKNSKNKNRKSDSKTKKNRVTKTNSVINKVGIKLDGFKKFFTEDPRLKQYGSKALNYMKANKLKAGAAVVGLIFAAGMFKRQDKKPQLVSFNPYQFSARQSAYLPGSYRRGFSEIKELTTDFGSRVHLDKTITKKLMTAINSTRNGFRTNTNAIINRNIALSAHKNAINHMRY